MSGKVIMHKISSDACEVKVNEKESVIVTTICNIKKVTTICKRKK